ncbi:hypothetical protein GCM10009784_08200 [Arthrobacter parietis]|uniref:Helicase-associated domain-containing protein n=1 Tax=Arthrobacter parietis TaxID=271434 RepID=A0ABN3AQK9_9MICC
MTAEEASPEDQWPPARSEDEWLLFYLHGLSGARIARLCRVHPETVRYSLRHRETLDPSIFGRRLFLHDHPRYRPLTRGRETAWDRRYTAVFRFVADQGRLPKQLGGSIERGLQRWLYTQRLKLEAGKLDPRQVELLDVLGEWRS